MTGDHEAVLAANQAFYRAFEKKDLAAMEDLWSQGISSICVHPGRDALKGWSRIRESWAQIFKNTRYLEISADVVSLEIQHNLAYAVVIENVFQVSNGEQIEAKSIATNVFERMGDRWYIVHHHGSPVIR